jgi:RNA-directed DNA polymerase
LEKACGHNPNVYAPEKSDTNIVPKKELNNAGPSAAEVPEVRTVTKGKF